MPGAPRSALTALTPARQPAVLLAALYVLLAVTTRSDTHAMVARNQRTYRGRPGSPSR
jgi:hypothetical protein